MPIVRYEDILATLPHLSREQLGNIQKKCAAAIALAGGKRSGDDDWLLRGIHVELIRRGLEEERLQPIQAKGANAGFTTQSERVRSVLEKGAPGLSRNELYVLGEIAAQCLANHIDSWDKGGLSISTLMRNVSRVPEAVDRAFPGYLEAGFLGMVVHGHFSRVVGDN